MESILYGCTIKMNCVVSLIINDSSRRTPSADRRRKESGLGGVDDCQSK